MAANQASQSRLRFLRLSVRGLMVLVLMLGAVLGWIVRSARIQREAVAAIDRAGGRVVYEWEPGEAAAPGAIKWLVARIGLDYFSTVQAVTLSVVYSQPVDADPKRGLIAAERTNATLTHLGELTRLKHLTLRGVDLNPGDVVHVAELTNLRELDLGSTGTRGADLLHLNRMTNLHTLSLDWCPIGNAGLRHIRTLRFLETLYLDNADLDDAGLAPIEALTNLRELHLQYTKITDDGLRHLGKLKNLQKLTLASTATTGAGLAHLAPLTNLRGLDLSGTKVGDSGLSALKDMLNLTDLSIQGTLVTDAGLVHLMGFPKLDSLDLQTTDVTEAGERQLRAAFPGLLLGAVRSDPGKRASVAVLRSSARPQAHPPFQVSSPQERPEKTAWLAPSSSRTRLTSRAWQTRGAGGIR